jgi:hypothetical protein
MGDLNARIGSAIHETDRYGQYGEPADDSKSVKKAEQILLRALEDHNLYALNSRQQPTLPDDNYTFVTSTCKSILDYALVTDQLYRAGATGTVLDADKWSIADSPHIVVGVAVPLRLYCYAATNQPNAEPSTNGGRTC